MVTEGRSSFRPKRYLFDLRSPASSRSVETRVAIYRRVSRVDQNPQLQEDGIREFVARRGWNITDEYLDHGVSGSREKRPALDRLLADARRRKFDLVVVWKSDRLFRSLKNMVNTLADLDALGVGFASVTEPFDTTTPSGRLLLHLVSAMAEFEKAILVERTRAGVAAARRRGAKLGRPRKKIDLDHARELLGMGRSLRQVSAEMGIPYATLYRAIRGGDPKTSSHLPLAHAGNDAAHEARD